MAICHERTLISYLRTTTGCKNPAPRRPASHASSAPPRSSSRTGPAVPPSTVRPADQVGRPEIVRRARARRRRRLVSRTAGGRASSRSSGTSRARAAAASVPRRASGTAPPTRRTPPLRVRRSASRCAPQPSRRAEVVRQRPHVEAGRAGRRAAAATAASQPRISSRRTVTVAGPDTGTGGRAPGRRRRRQARRPAAPLDLLRREGRRHLQEGAAELVERAAITASGPGIAGRACGRAGCRSASHVSVVDAEPDRAS